MPQSTTIVFVADLHVGHPFAVCPAEWTLHDGNAFRPNPLQVIIRQHWRATWERIGVQRKKRRLIVCVVGDAIEGLHHSTTQLITARTDTQEAMAVAVLEEGLALAHFGRGDTLRYVTGTPAHDGLGAQSAERIARFLTGYSGDVRQSCDYWRASVHGVLFDVGHRPGSGAGTRNWVRGNAFQGWLKSLYLDALELGQSPPRYVIRAHRHQYIERHVHAGAGHIATTGYILAPWKAKDEYVYQVAPEAIASIGALTIDVDADGTTRAACWRVALEQDQTEVL